MALDEELVQENANSEALTDEEESELSIMVNIAKDMIDEAGYKVIQQALESKDPGVVIGQFIMQLGSQLGEQLPFDPSPRIMLAEGGWVEQISDYLQEEYDVPKKVMDRAEIFVGSSARAMAQGDQQQAPQQGAAAPPQPAAPPIPEGGM
ncbi:MAG: hypothetical protein WCR70_09410 [Sphaerochaetaceae bacterium]